MAGVFVYINVNIFFNQDSLGLFSIYLKFISLLYASYSAHKLLYAFFFFIRHGISLNNHSNLYNR